MTDALRAASWVALANAALPATALVALLRAFETPANVLSASRASIERIAGKGVHERIAGRDAAREEKTLAWLAAPGHRLLAWEDVDYPRALLEIADPPLVLYALGRVELLARPALAIVGSRHGTPQGCEDASAFARTLADAGLTIVSGLAQGIDAAAHRGALPTPASTIAVTGTGPDRVYPASQRDLAHAIVGRGCLVTEFAPGTPPLKGNFPRRNRLIAGLARGVLVVEAAPGSGSLITARCANEQGRDVFAVPGSIHSPLSKGPHKLIRDGAKLVETAQDVLAELGIAAATAGDAGGRDPSPPADPLHARILDAMGRGPVDLDRLVTRTGLAAEALAASLVHLELDGRVATLPGGGWSRLN
ncbi:MAG: DNA-processing protein DprA [Betaproteobacteria bacterium]